MAGSDNGTSVSEIYRAEAAEILERAAAELGPDDRELVRSAVVGRSDLGRATRGLRGTPAEELGGLALRMLAAAEHELSAAELEELVQTLIGGLAPGT
jgi:hypothetical protein